MEDINGSRPNAAPKPKKRPNRFVRFLAFLVTLALMVGAVALVANYDKLNFDFIKRWFSYRTLARNDSGQAESFHFVGDSSNAFAVVDGDLLVCSPNTIRLYSGSGQAFVDQAVSMTNPVVSTAGGTALVYDAGGRELFVYSGREEVFSLTQEDGEEPERLAGRHQPGERAQGLSDGLRQQLQSSGALQPVQPFCDGRRRCPGQQIGGSAHHRPYGR